MTCFWTGIIKSLSLDIINETFNIKRNKKPSEIEFINLLKKHIKRTPNVLFLNKKISVKEQTDNIEHIKNIETANIYQGYDCSSCDPVLLLICELFKCDIDYSYNYNLLEYVYKGKIKNPSKLKYFSSTNHFWS